MGRFKIKQGDGSFKKVAWKDEVDNIAGSGRTTETVKVNADDIKNLQDNKVDKIEGKSLISDIEIQRLAGIDNYDDTLVMDDIENLQDNKVDKVDGKGLSTNDYTTVEKNKLSGIATGANNYTHPTNHAPGIIAQDASNRFVTDAEKASWNTKETPAGAQAKATTALNSAKEYTDTHSADGVKHILATERTKWNTVDNKVDKVAGKQLSTEDYTNEEKDKLLGISDEATKVESSTTNGNIKINGTETKVYNDTEIVNKIGDLSKMPTTEKNNLAGAVGEVKNEVTSLKEDYAKDKQPFHFNHVAQEYLNIDKFFEPLKDGRIYTSEFNQFNVSPSPNGVKKDDNEKLVCEPSTNTVRGRNDYEKIGLFMALDVNAYVDISGDYHVTAIKDDGRFAKDGTMGDVYVMSMAGYQKRYETDTVWGVSYSDTMHAGSEILDEAVKPDGTIRPFLLHAKYVAGRNPHENNNLASISGVYPEFVNMSHNGQITEFGKKGSQYSGKTSHDDYYVQLMMWLKYATTHSQSIMKGCETYYLQYTNLAPEIGVKRVIITNSQANNLLIGSTVSIGDYGTGSISIDRQSAQNYNIANRVKITDIVDLGDGNSVVYVDSPNTFDTTLTTTITTYPWNTGGCDNVLGQDGSPYSNTSGKEPFIINGIEMCVGGYEVLQNLIIHNNSDDNRIDVYANYDCTTYATSPNANYNLVGQLAQTNNTWKYGSKMVIPKNHPSVILVTETDASSTTGTGDGIYTNPPSNGGYRVWRSLGLLSHGALCGLRYLYAADSLAYAYWAFLGRLSATGQSRRRAGVN